MNVKAPKSYDDLLRVNGVRCETFRESAEKRGSNSDVFIRSYCYFSVMSAQYGSPGAPEKEMLNESKLKDFFMDLNTYSRMRIRMGPGCLSMMSPGCAPSPNPSACSSQ
ncbi:hypothetical protein FXO38_30404 [Capsicum annuum]|nr:hypothetical protein FXO38_30404 [Capsicum annuum]KAF3670951.1 hypothetical protein FXO37_08278 [Capsicum annuum]